MKCDNFNKIGDTQYRVKNQIKAYINFSQWYTSFWHEKKKYPNDVDFRAWVRECKNPYNYSKLKKDKIKNRLDNVLKNALHKYKLIKIDPKGCCFNLEGDDYCNQVLNKLANSDGCNNDTSIAFRAMLEFMINSPEFNDAKKIAFAFFTFEKGDDFYKLYNCTINDLVCEIFKKHTAQKIISKSFLMRKPFKMKPICLKILSKSKSFVISDDEFQYLKKNNYLSQAIDSKSKFEGFIKEESFDKIAQHFLIKKFTKLLYGDYFDLFNRVMFGLNLSDKFGKNVGYYNNDALRFDDCKKLFYVEMKNTNQLPYSHEEINSYLHKINKKDFSFINNDIHLCDTPAYTIAEYFVNLKICKLFNLKYDEIKESVGTILDNNLYPICHAPGGKSDMCLVFDKILLSFETTINSSERNISNCELYPCFEHLASHKPPYDKNILFLVLTGLLQKSDMNFIKKSFNMQAKVWSSQKKREFFAKILTFSELININSYEQILSYLK